MALGSVSVGGEHLKNKLGVPNGVATLDANGKLAESQRPEVDAYTKGETDEKLSNAVSKAEENLGNAVNKIEGQLNDTVSRHNTNEESHADIRHELSALRAELNQLRLQTATDIKKNSFSTAFNTLNEATVTGVWNSGMARIEF